MSQSDLPLGELRSYAPDLAIPPDLDGFWSKTLDEARTHDPSATLKPVDNGLAQISTFDVTFAGFGGSPVSAFNAYGGPEEIREYPFNGHEGGQGFHEVAKLRWLRDRLHR